jgi:hypothetical protein
MDAASMAAASSDVMRNLRRMRWAGLALAAALAIGGCQGAGSPSPSVVPDPTPTPPPPSADAVIRAFVAVATDPALSMHVASHGKVTVTASGTAEDLKVGFDMDISGADGVGKAIVDTGPSNVTFEMLVTGGHAYIDDDGTWVDVPEYRPSMPLNPFAGLTGAADLTYRGHEIRDGQRVHHLSMLPWPGGDLSLVQAQGWTLVKIDYSLTTLTVTDDGAPIEMSFSGAVSGRFNDVGASAAFEVTYEFTNVGEPVEIPVPA